MSSRKSANAPTSGARSARAVPAFHSPTTIATATDINTSAPIPADAAAAATAPEQVAEPEDPITIHKVDTATHIVVEHHKSGTVKTHVFSSKDGQPSLLGHAIPDINGNSLSTLLDDNLEALNALVQDSLEATKRESLNTLDGLRYVLEESGGRAASQVSLATTSIIEAQIRTELVPKLDKIEYLLLRQEHGKYKGKSKSKARSVGSPASAEGSPATSASGEDSHTSMEPMEPSALGETPPSVDQEGADEGEEEYTNAFGSSEYVTPTVLEKLTTIESQVEALCKVVIEGQVPSLLNPNVPDGHESENNPIITRTCAPFNFNDSAAEDSDALTRLGTMRDEMLTFPDALKVAHSTMQELIHALATDQEAAMTSTSRLSHNTSAENQVEDKIHREEQEHWQESMLQMMSSHHEGLGSLGTQFQTMDSSFQRMDTEFHDWKRSHQLSLRVYLKYMYWVFKRTESVDAKIHKALEEIKEQTAIEPQQQVQFSTELDQMRTEILAVLTSLPDMILSQLRNPSSSEHPDGAQQANQPSDDDDTQATPAAANGESQSDESVAGPRDESRGGHVPGSRALGMPCLKSLLDTEHAEEEAPGCDNAPASDPVEEVRARHMASSNTSEVAPSDSAIEKLVQTVETLQANITSMLEKYAELASLVTPPCDVSDPTLGNGASDSVPESAPDAYELALTESALASTPEVPREIHVLPPRETDLERRIRLVEERLLRQSTASAPEAEAIQTPAELAATEAAEWAAGEGPSARSMAAPASGYRQMPAPNVHRNDDNTENRSAGPWSSMSGYNGTEVPPVEPTLAPQGLVPGFFEQLESMNRNLNQLLGIITSTTNNLAQGHNHLHRALQLEIERVILAINPPETEEDRARKETALEAATKAEEERRTAFDRISIIPNFMTSLENVNFHHSAKIDEVMREVGEVRAFAGVLDHKIVLCHQDVVNVLNGSIEDSSVLNDIKNHVEVLASEQGCPSDMFLKAQVAEAIKTSTNVFVLVEDVKKISEKALEHQEALEKKVDALHKKHDEGLETCCKKHDDGWQAWNDKHAAIVTNIEGWHDKHDKDLRDLDAWRHMHGQQLEGWHRKHDESLESWHRSHEERLSEPKNRNCNCCQSVAEIEAGGESNLNTEPVSADVEVMANEDPEDEAFAQHGSRAAASPTESVKNCCGENILGDHHPAEGEAGRRSPATLRARQLFEEFLREAIPGYDGCCLACGRPSQDIGESPASSTSGVVVPESPGSTASPAVAYAGHAALQDLPLEDPTIGTNGDQGSPGSLQHGAMGESATYHGGGGDGAGVSPPPSAYLAPVTPLPRALYDFLRPYFHPAETTTHTHEHTASATDFEALASVRRELADLQEQFIRAAQESRESEEAAGRLMNTILEKDQEIDSLVNDREKMVLEFGQRTMILDQEVARLWEKLATRKRKHQDANATIEKLYREGLGLSTGITAEASAEDQETRALGEPVPIRNHSSDAGSDAESIDTTVIPRYSLMAEAAEHLRQALEEFKQQKSELHHDIGMLDAKRSQLLEDIANVEGQFASRNTNDPAALPAEVSSESIPEAASHIPVGGDGEQDEGEEHQYVDEDEPRSRTRARTGSSAGSRGSSTVRQQRRLSARGRRGVSQGRSARRMDTIMEKVPQLEADIRICKDGNVSETLLSSKTLLTEEQFNRIRPNNDDGEEEEDGEMWSLNCDFKVRMVRYL